VEEEGRTSSELLSTNIISDLVKPKNSN